MMGNKNLREIRSELRRRLAESGLDRAWFDEQIRKLQQGPRPIEREIETLRMLQKVAADAQRKVVRRSRGKKQSRSAS